MEYYHNYFIYKYAEKELLTEEKFNSDIGRIITALNVGGIKEIPGYFYYIESQTIGEIFKFYENYFRNLNQFLPTRYLDRSFGLKVSRLNKIREKYFYYRQIYSSNMLINMLGEYNKVKFRKSSNAFVIKDKENLENIDLINFLKESFAVYLSIIKNKESGQIITPKKDFVFEGFTIKNDHGFSEEEVQHCLFVLKEALDKIKEKGFNNILYGDMILSKALIGSKRWGGFYIPSKDHVEINVDMFNSIVDTDVSYAKYVTIHEIGHRLWFKILSEDNRREYAKNFHLNSCVSVSKYGSTQAAEDFAEVFLHYVADKPIDPVILSRFETATGRSSMPKEEIEKSNEGAMLIGKKNYISCEKLGEKNNSVLLEEYKYDFEYGDIGWTNYGEIRRLIENKKRYGLNRIEVYLLSKFYLSLGKNKNVDRFIEEANPAKELSALTYYINAVRNAEIF
jgi:hypothetical protein